LLDYEMPLPSLPEQQRIVARIVELTDHVSEARNLRHESDQMSAHLVDSFRLTMFRDAAEYVPLGSVCAVVDPNPSHRYPVYVDEGVPIISSSEFVGEDDIDWSRARHVLEGFYQETLGRFDVGEGDVVFSRKGKIGYARPHPAEARLAMTHTLCVLQPNRALVEPQYLLHFTRSPMFLDALTGTMNPNVGVPTLGLGVIRDTSMPVPPLTEQRRIVAELSTVENRSRRLKELQADASTDLCALVPAILDRAFKEEL
jgi:type I restriction enzyme S subunit